MALDLVDYERKGREAVQAFWKSNAAASQGKRAAITAGKSMAGYMSLVHDIVRANGLAHADIHQKHTGITLPGYFGATKSWDIVVINKGELIAAIKLKSQIGSSFGNSFNSKAEKAVANAYDLKTAYAGRAFGSQQPPFVGWLTLVEDTPKSRAPVNDKSPHFSVFKRFEEASYLKRYELLCQKLVMDRLYTTATLIASPRSAVKTGEFSGTSSMTSLKTFVTSLAGHVAAEAARLG